MERRCKADTSTIDQVIEANEAFDHWELNPSDEEEKYVESIRKQ